MKKMNDYTIKSSFGTKIVIMEGFKHQLFIK